MQAIQAQAAQWGLLARKLKRPGEPSDAEEKLAQDIAAGQVSGEALAAADPGTTDVQAGMEAIDSLTGAGESVQLASLSDGQMLAQAGATTSGSGSAAPSAAASSAAGDASAATASAPYLPLALVLGGVGLVAASGNSSAPAEVLTIKGKLVDGYIAGATVFVDLNKNGQLDAGEASTVSDAQGNFTLPQGLNGPIVAIGGRDISTGLDFTGVLKAPAGSTTVTPLTTLVNELMTSSGLSATAAQDRVLDAVGLSALKGNVDLTKLDPVAGAAAGTAGALDLQKAGVMVATMVSSLTVKVQQTAGAGVDKHDEIASGIFAQVASTLTGTTTGQLSASQIASTANTVVNTLAAQATPTVGGVSFNGATMKAASVSALENLGALASKVASATTVDALAGNQKTALTQKTFTLQLLHFSDAEAGLLASTTAPKLAALIDKFEDTYAHSITLAGGDNFIPGPFLAAGTDTSIIAALNSTAGGTLSATATVPIAAIDIAIHNAMGVEASAIGNHEFDLGSRVLSDAIKGASGAKGAQFPHISANLDFSGDNDLKSIYVDTTATAGLEEAASLKGKIVPSAILVEGGAKIGLVGATTQLLESISSPSGTKVKDNDSVRSDDMTLLAAQLQPVINDLIAQGVNKIILMAHLQLLPNERLLATKLQGVDIILAAGSNTRLGDANDTAVAFAGHEANFADTYPLVIKDKDGKNTLVVNTDNEFTYLGRLVVDFDDNGHIVTDSLTANAAINGAYASTDANVATAWGTTTQQLSTTAYASGTRGAQVKALTDAVQSVITVKDGNVYGYADVYLEGERIAVRNQETNLGNITADANSYALEQALGGVAAQTYIVSLKNGGGIRAQIGAISAPKSDGTVDKLPPEGGVSQLDVENSLRFNNQLMSFDTTPAGLKAILEHGVASLGSQGRFPQLSGVSFSYDPDLAAGSRISDIALVDEGYRVNLYNDGALLAGAPAKITVVTLNFLANDGDAYPIKANGENFRYVVEQAAGGFALTAPVDEAKNFTDAATITDAVGTSTLLGEQRAFEVYMKAFHATPQTAYKQAETAEAQDTRIQNLNVRAEDVLMTQLGMSPVGTFATNAYNAGGAEIVAFDAGSKRMFLVNAVAAEIQVVSLADPANPVLVGKLDLKGYATTTGSAPQVNSVASAGGVVAVALADADPTKAGKLVLFKADLTVSTTAAAPSDARALDTGVGPDMVTFTPDGKRLLVANEAESINERASTDAFYNAGAPFVANGGITVVTLGSEAASAIANATVQQIDFSAYNGKEGLLRERGVRIAAGATAANDLEPEYIAVSPDGKQAMVTLQENNAVAVLNLSGATASIVDIVALGYKNHARGDLVMTAYDTLSSTELGTIGTDVFGKAVPAGGFSGLHYTGLVNGKMRFLSVSDRGPNGEPVNVDADAALERPFVLPNYQARVSTLEFDPVSEQLSIVSTTLLTRADGTPLTGLPNIPGTDEEPVQIVPATDTTKTGTFTSGTTTLGYKTLAYDTLGADLEGIFQTTSGNMWMVDEYRPAVYEFDAAGKMVARFVPAGTAALTADTTDNFGKETLPMHLIKRQPNRGFEALAVDEAKGLLFAFVQSPLDSVAGSTVDTAGPLVRIEVMAMRDLAAGVALPQGGTLAAAVSKGAVIAEYAYLLDRPTLRVSSQIDKIGDAAFNPATGTIFVFERDNEIVPEGKKMLFEIDLRGATNLLTATPTLPTGKTELEALTVDELLAAGINPVYKELLANLPTLGFLPNDKAEGLALLPNGGLAVINDNDFGVNGAGTETVGFGVLNFNGANRIDADNDTTGQPSGTIPGVNIVKAGLYGAYMPDGIAAFSAKGKTYYITANEGDSRGVDEVSVKDLGATGKPVADASAGAALIDGDLKVLANGIDVDGDNDIDKLVAFGGRSFSILDAYGNRVFDSGDQIERLIAEVLPAYFNASHTSNALDNRSDDKGPEPEGVTTAVIDGKVYAFVGLERIGGVVVYDISDPYQPSFVSYSNNRDFSKTPALAVGGDLGPEGLLVIPATASPTGKPLVLVANEISGTVTLFNAQQTLPTETDPKLWLGEQLSGSELGTYTLQLLHFADAEAGMLASSTAPKLAALIDKFEDAYTHSITLAGGDNFLPGPFLAAGTDDGVRTVFNSVTGSTVTSTMPIAGVDIALHNLMGVQASGLGNHEFDLGSNVLVAAFGGGSGFGGAQFPYISANLDVSADSSLKARYTDTLATAGLEEASALKGRLAPSAIITEGGEKIGLVGATTQILESISSPSGTKVKDNDSVRSDDMDLLAAQLQPVINDLMAQGVNKIILMAHLQVLANEKLLATKLQGVDIILAAGSNTRLGDANDTAVAFAGHDAKFADSYPLVIKDKDGKNTLVMNTDNEFTYLGRLVVDFDANGHILPSSLAANTAINGAYASTDANVAAAWGASVDQLSTTAYASGTRGGQVKALTDAVQTVITAKDGSVYGYADVYLEGERIAVRNQETNLGNITADANSYALEQALGSAAAQTYTVSLKNGGGIRAQIGTLSAPKADGTVDKLPPEGGVSQLDVENSLRFNNQLMSFETTPAGLKAILEHGVASLGSQGRFPQLSGVSFSYDPDLVAGSRISDIALVDEGSRVNLYNDGALMADAPAKITVVTLNFLANGGDSYPIKANGENFRYVVEQAAGGFALTAPVDEAKNFTDAATITDAVGTSTLLGEQRAFEVYMKAFHATPQTAYKQAETTEALDTRIQNLNVRAEDVLSPHPLLSFTAPGESVDLANYTLVGRFALPAEPTAANKLAHEASAVTYNKDTDTLFVVGDGGTGVTQVSKQGVLIDSMALATGSSPQGTYFYDTEGLAYIGNGRFVMVEERDRELNEFTYVAGSTLGANSTVRTVKLGTSIGNVGLEGLGLDPLSSGFLLAKEASPMGVFQTTVDFAAGTASNGSATTENSVNLFDPAKTGLVSVNDIYALSNVLEATATEAAHMLLLGAADGKVLEMDRSGNILGTLKVGSVAKNEGLTMGTDRRLYVVGEEGGGSLDKPELLVYAPTTGRAAVGLGSHVYLSFNGQVSAGTGNIVISNGKGDTRSIDVTDASQVKITGSSVKIDPTADFASDQTYTVTYASGVFKDASNAARVALTGETLSFKTVGDVLPPQLTATSPVDNAFGVTSHHTILTFSEAVKAGTGNIVLRGQNSGGLSDVRSIAVTDVTQVTISGQTVDINPAADLFNGYSYAVEVPAGAITDTAGNAFPGLASLSALTFTRNSGTVAGPQTVIISEVNSNAGPADFFELYNHGSEPVALDGWKWDDDSASFTDAGAGIFAAGTKIEPGARLVVVASASADAFRTAWGLGANVPVVATGGPGLGAGDAIVVFNEAGKAVTALNYGITAKTASDGSAISVAAASAGVTTAVAASHAGAAFGGTTTASAVWDGVSVQSPAYRPAVVGQLGGFSQAAAAANIGSPGLIAAAQATDTTAPTLASAMPVAGSSSALASSNIVLSLSESVKAGTGNIVLVNAADASDTRTIAVTDATQVSFSSGLVTINPSADLRAGASYSVQMAAGVIDDLAGNDFAGLAGSQALSFSVAASAPRLLITELNSNAGPADFFEILNYGDAAVSLKGWKWDDDSASFADGVAIANVSIPAGGTLVVASTTASTLATFKTTWGLADSVQVITSEGPGLGGGDAVVLFNDAGSVVTSFNYSGSTKLATDGSTIGLSAGSQGVTFVAAVHAGPAFGGTVGANSVSAVWDGASLSAPTYRAAQVGVDGGLAQTANAANIGSPGSVPALPVAPGNGATKISAVQGAGAAAAKLGEAVTIEGIVTAFMPGLSGFFVQEEAADQDSNSATSEGLFVYYNTTNPGVSAANVGDTVRVSGTVSEYQKLSQLSTLTAFTVVTDRANETALPAPVSVTLPVAESFNWESVEGMRVEVKSATTNGNLVVTDNYVLGRYGSVTLTSDELLVQYTQQNAPSVAGFTAYSAATQRDQIVLDDGNSAQNPAAVFGRGGQALSASNTLRAGDTTASVVGIVDQFDNGTAPAYETTYRVQSTATPVFAGAARQTAEQLQSALGTAEIKVASVNVLNFFNTLGTANFNNPNGTALAGRGADNQAEYVRQLDKVVANLLGLDADVYGLMEIQNNGYADGVSALDALVDALNAKVGSAKFAYVAGPYDDGSTKAGDAATAGDDAIMVALVYDQTAVAPLGRAAVPDAVTYDAFGATFGNRVPVAQTFQSLADGETFTVAVNHLKSKGSVLDADTGDGQSANNLARMEGVKDLSAWLATNPTGAPDADLLLIGDLNAYAKESPISFLEGAGYNLVSGGLSYSFDGLWGSLDHAMANASMKTQVSKSVLWTSNAEEPVVLDYNTNFKSVDQQTSFYAADAYRSSDHNPVLIGLNLSGGTADTTAPVLQSARVDGNKLTLSYAENLQPGALPAANAFTLTVNGQAGPAVTQVAVRGQTATLTLAQAVVEGQTVTLAYADPTSANDANALQDVVGNDAAALTAQAVVNATLTPDTTAPLLSTSTPAAMATGVAPTANVVLNFNEPVVKGSGTITIRHQLNGLVLETIDVASERVTVSGSSVTIDPVKTLALGKGYAVEVPAGAIEDAKGNDHAGLVGAGALKFTVTAGTPVFISEIHYDNNGTDSGEGVSIFGPAGTSLAGWSVVPYNGSNGQSYTPLGSLSGSIDNENNSGFGELTFAISGLQNGAPDAIALVNAANQVVQLLSYEGSFAATNGPASGLTSTDIGVSQSGTEAAGLTLQIGGTGTLYEQLAWAAPATGSQGTINSGHTVPAVPSSTLGVGDLVFLGANGDAVDAFAFAILKDVAAGTKIGFTDRNYVTATEFVGITNESAFIWTADQNYAAGTIVTIQPDVATGTNPLADKGTTQGAGGGLSTTAETVYAFLGDIAALATGSAGAVTVTQMLASLNVGGAAAGDVPASIGATSVSLSLDNARYNGSFDYNDLPAFLLAADNPANWQTSDTTAFALVNNSLFPV